MPNEEKKKKSAIDRLRDFLMGHIDEPVAEAVKGEPRVDRDGNIIPETPEEKEKKQRMRRGY